ncbi:MAG TPA: hypothetical protein VIG74_05455, partial [Alphaproteobacteria bacterium]
MNRMHFPFFHLRVIDGAQKAFRIIGRGIFIYAGKQRTGTVVPQDVAPFKPRSFYRYGFIAEF